MDMSWISELGGVEGHCYVTDWAVLIVPDVFPQQHPRS